MSDKRRKRRQNAPASKQVIFAFGDPLDPKIVGAKYYQLAQLVPKFPVPSAICVGVEALHRALRAQPDVNSRLVNTTSHLYRSRGYQLEKHVDDLSQVLSQLRVPADIEDLLHQYFEQTFGRDAILPLVVRSSATLEDQRGLSSAGIYESFLNLMDWNAVLDAIRKCWISYYSYRAISYRLLMNISNHAPQMAVIIQHMVKGEWSGVAFSRSPLPIPDAESVSRRYGYVEFAPGTAEAVVGGHRRVHSAFFDSEHGWFAGLPSAASIPAAAVPAIRDAYKTVGLLDQHLNSAADLEWTWTPETGLWVLQVRPAQVMASNSTVMPISYFEVVDLYQMPTNPKLDLHACTSVYEHWSRKRGPLRQRAAAAGILLGGVAGIESNLEGALSADFHDCPALGRLGTSRILLDAGPRLRQIEIWRTDIKSRVIEVLRSSGAGLWVRQGLLLREYVVGLASLLSTTDSDGRVVVEFALQPLSDLTRGFAHTWLACVSAQGELTRLNPASWSSEAADFLVRFSELTSFTRQLVSFTQAESKLHPGVSLEWVVDRERLVLVDASYSHTDSNILLTNDYRCLSLGRCDGTVVRVDGNDWRSQLSSSAAISLDHIPGELHSNPELRRLLSQVGNAGTSAIVVASRPEAALSVLLGRVGGFVFEDGPLLCHLGILLREHGIPAIFSHEAYSQLRNGQNVTLVDGDLFIAGTSQ